MLCLTRFWPPPSRLSEAGAGQFAFAMARSFDIGLTPRAGNSAMWLYLSEHPATPGRASVAGRVLLSGKPEAICDTLSDSELKAPVHALTGSRSVVGVPLLRDDLVEGALMVGRTEAGPFDSRHIELLQTFADQAVIAIENARLFDDVQAKTRDLGEALQQQTATADLLKVISRSAFDLQPVLDALISSAVQLSGALNGAIVLREGKGYRYRATSGIESDFAQFLARAPSYRWPRFYGGARHPFGPSRAHSGRPGGHGVRGPHSYAQQNALPPRRAVAAQRQGRGRARARADRAGRIHPSPGRAYPHLRGPSRHRHRKRSTVRRGAGKDA